MNLIYKEDVKPGFHALVVGVSAYSNLPSNNVGGIESMLGLRQLQSTALTAYRVANWLVERRAYLHVPLASCRLLVVPSKAEMAAEPRLADLVHGCTFDHFYQAAIEWRRDASSHADNFALFYFAGHGAQRSRHSHVMLMQDFGSAGGIFGKAVETEQLIDGMVPSVDFQSMALTQLYFIDACRIRPSILRKYDKPAAGALWDPPDFERDDRAVSVFHAATAGRTAYGRKGEQTGFSAALLQCLNRDAAEAEVKPTPGRSGWRVSIHSLARVLEPNVMRLSAAIKKSAALPYRTSRNRRHPALPRRPSNH